MELVPWGKQYRGCRRGCRYGYATESDVMSSAEGVAAGSTEGIAVGSAEGLERDQRRGCCCAAGSAEGLVP